MLTGSWRWVCAIACSVTLGMVAPAQGEVTAVFDDAVPCTTEEDGTRFCGGNWRPTSSVARVPEVKPDA